MKLPTEAILAFLGTIVFAFFMIVAILFRQKPEGIVYAILALAAVIDGKEFK